MNRVGCDGRIWTGDKPAKHINDKCVKPIMKFGGGSIMIWGCITAFGPGMMCLIPNRMTGAIYTEILDDYFLPTLDRHKIARGDFVYQYDSNPKLTSRVATEWIQDSNICVLEWPPQSPDLNPIEHTWCLLKRRASDYSNFQNFMNELWLCVERKWDNITQNDCQNLIDSMPNRIEAVLKAKGGYTKY